MTRPATLEYEGYATPSHYEWEMESERARWLRRRFLWFTGTLLVLALLSLPFALGRLLGGSGLLRSAGALETVALLVQIGVAGWAWWYARRAIRNARRLFSIAFLLVVGLGVFSIFAMRASAELAFQHDLQQLEQRQAARQAPANAARELLPGAIEVPVTAAPPPRVNRRSLAQHSGVSLLLLCWAVLSTHLVACLFLPWTVREATRPALILLAAAGVVVLIDLLLGQASLWYVAGAIATLPLMVLPGTAWCWWRHSRFRRQYRFTFEGDQLRRLRQELMGARRIHEATLPPAHPHGPIRLSYIYEPMSAIGGDVIFVHPRPPSDGGECDELAQAPRHTMVLLDVTGHGIAAALTVNRLVGELERLFAEKPDLCCSELMATLNRYVYLTLARHGIFVTGLAISVETGHRGDSSDSYQQPQTVTFSSAGHPSAFVHRADGGIEALESNATMLGVLPPESYHPEKHVFRLRPGDSIVAYTDGALEARNLDDEMIGIDGVRDMIVQIAREVPDPFHWPQHLLRRVANWRRSPPADDTLIAVIYRPPVPAEAAQEAIVEPLGLPEAALAGAPA